MSIQSHTSQSYAPPSGEPPLLRIPQLETGDCLSRDEFERRYEAMPKLHKAELINGVVYVGSPVSTSHGDAHALVIGWLTVYVAQTPGIRCSDNASVRLDLLNEVQPDALLRIIHGGQSNVAADKDVLEGPPELIVEVASSSVSRDLHDKLNLYRRHGVREYLVWRVMDEDFDWFVLRSDGFERHPPDDASVFRSTVFPGLWLDKAALLRGDMASVLAVLGRGIASPEHAQFAATLAR